MLEVVKSPWEGVFLRLLCEAKSSVYLASPFIKTQTASLIAQNIRPSIDFRYINSFKLAYFHTGASDLEALRILNKGDCRQKSIQNLHAKLFIFDNAAVVTSGNLTPGGMRNNIEYGVIIRDDTVQEIRRYFLDLFDDQYYPEITQAIIDKAESILSSIPEEKRPKINVSDQSLFDDISNDQTVSEKFDGGTVSILSNLSPWGNDVFDCMSRIGSDVFTLTDAYAFESYLGNLHPRNRHVKDKIRQQLQYLRKIGLIEFVRPGIYKKLWTK